MQWSTHDEATNEKLHRITKELSGLLTTTDSFAVTAEADIPPDVTTLEEAEALIRNVRRGLMLTLLAQETHEHWLDDCGDDLQAATDKWIELFMKGFFYNDGQDLVEEVNKGLARLRDMYGRD